MTQFSYKQYTKSMDLKNIISIAAFATDNSLCSGCKAVACCYLGHCVTEIIPEILFGILQSILPLLKAFLTSTIPQIEHL